MQLFFPVARASCFYDSSFAAQLTKGRGGGHNGMSETGIADSLASASTSREPDMPRDAKLGFVIGLGLVVFIAVAFVKKGAATAQPPAATVAPAAVSPATPPPSERASPQPAPVTKAPSP